MRSKRSIYNLITAIGSQIVLLVLGLIIPRLTLSNYGSETNGFMNLVSQVYAYIALLEAGLGTAEIQALYGPVSAGDRDGISTVVNVSRRYYQKLALSYGTVVLVVAVILPIVVRSGLSPVEMAVYFMLFGLPRIVNFWLTQHMRNLLTVEGKNYIGTMTNLCVSVGSSLVRIALLWFGVSLIPLQLAYTACNLAEVLFYYIYIRKRYSWIQKTPSLDAPPLRQRNVFFVQQMCTLVFRCTDILLLSTFHDLRVTSVYAVYMLIYNALSSLLYTVFSSTHFILGQIYHEDPVRHQMLHRIYEMGYLWLSFVFYTTAYVLALPFVRLYTAGITDADYLVGAIPLLLTINSCLMDSRCTTEHLLNLSYHAKQTLWQIVTGAALNLGISLILVKPFGIPGVLMGTCLATVFRLIVVTVYTNREIFHTTPWRSFWVYGIDFAVLGVVIFARSRFDIVLTSYFDFIKAGIVTVIAVAALYTVVNVLANFQLVRGAVIGARGRLQQFKKR